MTSTKTGQPAIFAGGSSDLKDVIPAVGHSFGIEDISAAIAFYKAHQGLIATILSFFGIGKKKNAPPVPVPAPVPEASPTTPPPAPKQRVPTGIRSKWFLIERKNTPGKSGGGRYIIGKDEFDAIVAGNDPARPGDRLHVNNTPYDAQGDFQPGGVENRSLLVDPNDPAGPLGRSRIQHVIDGNGELTSEYDDYGCTPVILIPWEGVKPDSDVESEVTYRARFNGESGVFDGDQLPTIRIKA